MTSLEDLVLAGNREARRHRILLILFFAMLCMACVGCAP